MNLTDVSAADKLDLNMTGHTARSGVLWRVSVPKQESTSSFFFTCCQQMSPTTNVSCKLELRVEATYLHIPYWFQAQIFSHKYVFALPQVKLQIQPNSWHSTFKLHQTSSVPHTVWVACCLHTVQGWYLSRKFPGIFPHESCRSI